MVSGFYSDFFFTGIKLVSLKRRI